MNIMVGFISLFLYILLTIGLPCSDLFPAPKKRNNSEEAPFVTMGASTEPENNFSFKLISERDIVFLLEIKCYSSDINDPLI